MALINFKQDSALARDKFHIIKYSRIDHNGLILCKFLVTLCDDFVLTL